MLRVKLRHLESWSAGRRQNANRYSEMIRDRQLLSTIELPTTAADRRHVYNQYTLRVRGGLRDTVMQEMRAAGVGCAVYYPIPLHMQKCFEYLGCQAEEFPESMKASAEVLSLPIFTELTEQQQDRVVDSLADAVASCSTLKFPTQGEGDSGKVRKAA